MVRLLLERGYDFIIESRERGGMSSLHQAARSGHTGIVKLLLRKGCLRSLEARNVFRETPLLYCLLADIKDDIERSIESKQREKAAQELISSSTDLSTRDNLGRSNLHGATYHGFRPIVAMLLERGFDVNDKGGAISTTRETTQSPYSFNSTPLHIAAEGLYPGVIQLLVDSGANVSSQNHEGKSPLHYAILS